MESCLICCATWVELLPNVPPVTIKNPNCVASKHIMCVGCYWNIAATTRKCPYCQVVIENEEYEPAELTEVDNNSTIHPVESQPPVNNLKEKSRNRKPKLVSAKPENGKIDCRTCEVCKKVLGSTGSLSNHRKRHYGSRDFRCPICSKGFLFSWQVRRHVRQAH